MAVSVAILGAGAVGGMLGVLLAKAGHDVTVLASDRTSTAINVNGLVLRSGRYGELHVRVPARPWLTAPVDVLFVTVKAPDLLAALTRVPGSLLRRGGGGAAAQRGRARPAAARGVSHRPIVVPMTVAVEATRLEPGVIEHLSPFADYAICAGHRELASDPAMLLRSAGLDVDSSAPDEATLLWRKLCLLAPLALLTTAARDALGPAREARPDLLDALVDETAAAAAAHEVRLIRPLSRSGCAACPPECAPPCSRTRWPGPRWNSMPSPARYCGRPRTGHPSRGASSPRSPAPPTPAPETRPRPSAVQRPASRSGGGSVTRHLKPACHRSSGTRQPAAGPRLRVQTFPTCSRRRPAGAARRCADAAASARAGRAACRPVPARRATAEELTG